MIDQEAIYKRVHELKNALQELAALGGVSLEEYESNNAVRWQVERGLQIAIQNLLDIGSHLLSAIGKNRCESYAAVIDGLAAERIIPGSFAEQIRGMAGLRNILVHDYLEIDNRLVYRTLKDQISDFHEFIEFILEYIERNEPET